MATSTRWFDEMSHAGDGLALCYITDRAALADDEPTRRRLLLERISAAAQAGVEFIQLREKDLGARELLALARAAVANVRGANTRTRLLINSRADIAIAAEAHGVHLPARDLPASDIRALLAARITQPIVSVSCHSVEEVRMAEVQGADFCVLGPVFGKTGSDRPPLGLDVLREACSSAVRPPMPVFALGAVTAENASECQRAGAAGVAGIRIFQQGDLAATIARLRAIKVQP